MYGIIILILIYGMFNIFILFFFIFLNLKSSFYCLFKTS